MIDERNTVNVGSRRRCRRLGRFWGDDVRGRLENWHDMEMWGQSMERQQWGGSVREAKTNEKLVRYNRTILSKTTRQIYQERLWYMNSSWDNIRGEPRYTVDFQFLTHLVSKLHRTRLGETGAYSNPIVKSPWIFAFNWISTSRLISRRKRNCSPLPPSSSPPPLFWAIGVFSYQH